MPDSPAPPPFAAVVVAAGKGLRAGQSLPKQFARWRGKPLVRHSVEALAKAGASPIVVAVPEGGEAMAAEALESLPGVRIAIGGATRQASVAAALESLASDAPGLVLVHDSARPTLPRAVVCRLLAALAEQRAAIPVLPVIDSIAEADGAVMGGSADRDALRRVQTPQAFRFADILAAHRRWRGEPSAADDAQVARAAGLRVALVEGDEALRKLTYAQDFADELPAMRSGIGYDVHPLQAGEDLWLCGLKIEHDKGLVGHSDADVGIHAVVDALLGAIAAGDIGQHFPPSAPEWRNASSGRFLEHAAGLVAEAGYRIGNIDLTLVCESPRIGPHREAMRARLAALAGVDSARVSVKATTTERLGFTGRGEGIAAQAIAAVLRAN